MTPKKSQHGATFCLEIYAQQKTLKVVRMWFGLIWFGFFSDRVERRRLGAQRVVGEDGARAARQRAQGRQDRLSGGARRRAGQRAAEEEPHPADVLGARGVRRPRHRGQRPPQGWFFFLPH